MAYLTYSVPIIGVSFHNAPHLWPELRGNASASLVKPRLLTGHFDLRLVAEPDNPADASAIRVDLAAHELADGQARTLGYIPRSHTTQVGLLLTEAVVLAPGLPDPQLVILPGLKSGASFSFTGDCGRHGPAVLCRLQRRSRVAAADAVPRRP